MSDQPWGRIEALWIAHQQTEELLETMGISRNATLARIRAGLADAAEHVVPPNTDNVRFFRGLVRAVPLAIGMWAAIGCAVWWALA